MQAEVLVILLSLMSGVELKWSDESTLTYTKISEARSALIVTHGEIVISVIKST
jgi:hypothetical protein